MTERRQRCYLWHENLPTTTHLLPAQWRVMARPREVGVAVTWATAGGGVQRQVTRTWTWVAPLPACSCVGGTFSVSLSLSRLSLSPARHAPKLYTLFDNIIFSNH